ncbi:BglG family transcription antiterminator [Brevibacillus humidisoli]|uniref:BglG family transcription antiterminator n=1 Tax=Brevibacillus humidisoli TaxID=2895522 RepID=UPI001E5C8C57|nr:BglG family transcription antiterminator [Brevibacillus humidisoli]UFJ39891.1 BglG family transcription antiterminator [Brevibacillus humidisoli]
MNVTARQRTILDILLREQQGLTVGVIAEQVGVSARTIHRELDAIEEVLRPFRLELAKKSGLGIELHGSPEQKEALHERLLHLTTIEYTPEERKMLILAALLEATEPIKLIALALDLKVTTATISHDLEDLADMLSKFKLTLIRKRGYGVEIQGSESDKRRAISHLISHHFSEYELIGLLRENIRNKNQRDVDAVSERLLGLIDKEKLRKVEAALEHLQDDLPYPLADSAYIGLMIHLALAVERIQKGENIYFDEHTLAELKETQEYRVAQEIVRRLADIFLTEIPVAEIGYITMHLRGAKLRSFQAGADWPENLDLVAKTNRFIQACAERMRLPLQDDPSLFHELLKHMEPAVYRLNRQMEIRNPILEQIRNNYPELFRVVKKAAADVFADMDVPDEEIGFLVLHIGAAVERAAQVHQRYRALVVCSSGIGSSKILATRLQKEIPELVSLRNVSLFDIGRIPKSEYEVIISTVPLPLDDQPYIVVSPLLPEDEIRKVRSFLQKSSISSSSPTEAAVWHMAERARQVKQPINQLKSVHQYTGYAIQLVEGFQLQSLNNQGWELEELLSAICKSLSQKGTVRDKEAVVQLLLEREKVSGLGITGTRMALFHGRHVQVVRPSFTAHRLQQPIYLRSMDDQQMAIHIVLLLLGPKEMSKEGLEVLSKISSLLIEEEMIAALESADEQVAAGYLQERLYEFCQKQIGMERVQ